MSEPTDDPPLVTRPDAPAPPRPRPGLLEAALWCLIFLAVQLCGGGVAAAVVFTAYTLAAPEPGKFADEQLDGFSKSVEKNPEGERPPMPFAIGQALAWWMLAAQLASLAVIAVVLPRRIGKDWKRQIGVRWPHGLHVALVLLVAPGFMIVAEFVQQLFVQLTGVEPVSMKHLLGVFDRFPWPLTLLAVAVGPGVVEELWFRGFLGRGLAARYGLVAGVLLTSALFAVVHLSPPQLLVYVLMGAYLHFVYVATRSIWPAVLLHALNNGIGITLMLVVPDKMDRPLPLVVPLAALALTLFASVALWTSRAELEPVTRKDEGWWESDGWKPESPGVSSPPADANVRLAYATVSPAALMFTFASFAALLYLVYRFAG